MDMVVRIQFIYLFILQIPINYLLNCTRSINSVGRILSNIHDSFLCTNDHYGHKFMDSNLQ